ncbi:TetR/AcrR family transcriptional regulator [Tsukamurella soli]|uniref:TetR/AcrR family transcriptional regulator n=1 Tax=Tsukamurella soli TaxID=644556 RepID=A0ABP8K9J1_9ACTN
MGRWQPDARERLEQAALDLFVEQGFAETTVPQITARAGLTTRTFYRHFADKREVLFGDEEIPVAAARMITEAPTDLPPMTLLTGALEAFAHTRFEHRRADLRRRRDIIRSDEGLTERELRKRAMLSEAARAALSERGLDPTVAALLAEMCVAVMYVSVQAWLDGDDDRPLVEILRSALTALRREFVSAPC